MRPIERIDKFFDKNVLYEISRYWEKPILRTCEFYEKSLPILKKYWKKNPDQRFGQALVNLNFIEDSYKIYNDEDFDLLMIANAYLGDIIKWRSYYDKDENHLVEPIDRYIQDLDTGHIDAIKRFTKNNGRDLPVIIQYCFNQELSIREESKKLITIPKVAPNKKIMNATPTLIDGLKFRSRLEAYTYKVLKENDIETEYEKHKYNLLDPFVYDNKKIRAMTYTPDFVGDDYILECKGYGNDTWPLKKKLFMKYLVDNGITKKFYITKNQKEVQEAVADILKRRNHEESFHFHKPKASSELDASRVSGNL